MFTFCKTLQKASASSSSRRVTGQGWRHTHGSLGASLGSQLRWPRSRQTSTADPAATNSECLSHSLGAASLTEIRGLARKVLGGAFRASGGWYPVPTWQKEGRELPEVPLEEQHPQRPPHLGRVPLREPALAPASVQSPGLKGYLDESQTVTKSPAHLPKAQNSPLGALELQTQGPVRLPLLTSNP